VVPQSWFPLFSYIKDRERATPYPSPPTGGALVAAVVLVEGLIQDWGLFPASDLSAQASPGPMLLKPLGLWFLVSHWD
jgi:hypothetical protein